MYSTLRPQLTALFMKIDTNCDETVDWVSLIKRMRLFFKRLTLAGAGHHAKQSQAGGKNASNHFVILK